MSGHASALGCLLAACLGLGSAAGASAAQDPAPLAPSAAGDPSATILSLDEAVQRALRQSPTLDAALAAIRRADAVVAEARAFQLPRLDADARFTLQGPIQTFSFTTPPTEPGGEARRQEIAFGKTFTRNYSITASVDPDPFGRLRARRRAAERLVNVSRGSYLTAQNELVFAVQNVYLSALRARELIEVQREALEAAQEQLRVAEAQFRAGTAPEFDVLRSRVQVGNVRQNRVSAEAAYRRIVATLARLVSLEPEAQLELLAVAVPPDAEGVAGEAARRILDPLGSPTDTAPASLQAALGEAFRRRPEVYRAEWARRAAEARVQAERRARLPTLALSASGFHNPDVTGFAAIERSWSVLAHIAFPIWDAGLSRARTRQARADVRIASADLEGARDAVVEDVKQARTDLEDAAERRRTAAGNTTLAREALRIAGVRYSAGLAPNVEVTDAEAALTQARANEVNAAYDYLAALAALNRSLGTYASESLATNLK